MERSTDAKSRRHRARARKVPAPQPLGEGDGARGGLPDDLAPPAHAGTPPAAPAAQARPHRSRGREREMAATASPQASPFDVEAFAKNVARLFEEGGKALAAYLKPREEGRIKSGQAEEISDIVKTLGRVMEYWLSDPQRTFELQTRLGRAYLELWASAGKRLAGQKGAPG